MDDKQGGQGVEKYLDIGEAAKFLGIHRDTVNYRISTGKLKAIVDPADNRRKLIKLSDLLKMKRPGQLVTAEELAKYGIIDEASSS